jgi:hypothetical protein
MPVLSVAAALLAASMSAVAPSLMPMTCTKGLPACLLCCSWSFGRAFKMSMSSYLGGSAMPGAAPPPLPPPLLGSSMLSPDRAVLAAPPPPLLLLPLAAAARAASEVLLPGAPAVWAG